MGLVIALLVFAPFAAAYAGVRYSRSHGPQIQPGAPALFHVARSADGEPLWRFEGGPPPE